MRFIFFFMILAFANGAIAGQVIECTASKYHVYTDGLLASAAGLPPIRVSIAQDASGKLSASFDVYSKPLEHRYGRPMTKTLLNAAVLGRAGFLKALDHLAAVTGNADVVEADSYEAYAIQRPSDGQAFVVIFSVKREGEEIARTLMWTGGAQPMGVCADTVRI